MEELKFIIFRLGEQKYGMNLKYINGIEQDYQIIPVPNALEEVKGIINLRGEVIPVYSLKVHFSKNKRIDSSGQSLLIAMSSGTLIAYEVDEVVSIEEVKKENINEMPPVTFNEENAFIEKVLHVGNDIVITIDVDKVLSESTKKMVDQLIEDNK